MFLFRPFRGKTDACNTARRVAKTPGSLYRILCDDFERTRECDCTCKMPVVIDAEEPDTGAANWSVETLWCGCPECRAALADVLARNLPLYDLKRIDD